MREYVATDGCRMEFLRRSLDDPGAAPCGRCDRCAGPFVSAEVSAPALAAAQAFLGRPGVDHRAEEALADGLCPRCAASSARTTRRRRAGPSGGSPTWAGAAGCATCSARTRRTARCPTTSTGAVVEVLKDWSRGADPWPVRPVAVVGIASRRRPALVGSLAARIAEIGRLQLLGQVEPGPQAPPSGGGARGNSAQRVRALHDAFEIPAGPGRRTVRAWTARCCSSTTWSTPAGR